MKVIFYRGDDHQIKFKLKNFAGEIEQMYFTVKCKAGTKRLQKKLNDGITKEDEYYIVTFVPSDTDNLPCYLNMIYDIEIITGGKKFTLVKDEFVILEDVTTPKDEV